MKYEIHISPDAKDDLKNINDYIKYTLGNPSAADRITGMLVAEIERLTDNPDIGVSISSRFGIRTDYRYLIADDYVIVYVKRSSSVRIIDVFNGRQDYLRILFN